jgi:hypothetical protein
MNEEEYRMLQEIAASRSRLHANHDSQRKLSPDYEIVGLAGELEFAKSMHIPFVDAYLPGGDRGIDFNTPIGTVDIKTFRRPWSLLVPIGNNHPADIYILAGYQDEGHQATLIGWTYWNIVQQQPVKDFGRGIINHSLAARRLYPMVQFKREIIKSLIGNGGPRVWQQLKLI